MPIFNPPTKHLERYLLFTLAITTMAVFSQVLWHDFINYDDPAFVYLNPYIQSGLSFDALRWAFTSGYEANWIPLTWISHILDVQFFGLNPAGHHAVNLLLHTASSCLLFVFLKRATGALWQSFAVACLFALHPLHVESVAWIAERKDVLSTFFMMLTLNAYVWYRQQPGVARYCATLACFALGLLSKSMLVTLPLVLLLLDWWPCSQFLTASDAVIYRRTNSIRLFVEKIPFLVLAAGTSAMTYWAHHASGEVTQGYTLFSRMGKSCIAYMLYLYKMIWPADLSVLYPFSKYPPSSEKVLLSLCALLLITGIAFWQRFRFPFLVTGWLWYLITMLPVIGLIQIGQHTIADRYTYIPLIGIFVMVAWGIPLLLERWRIQPLMVGVISAIMLVGMITVTIVQLRYWKNSFTLFSHAVAVTNDNWVAQNNLALVYMKDEKYDEAIIHLSESIKAKPSYALAYMNLGVAYRGKRDFQKSLDAFNWALVFQPGNATVHFNLALLYLDFDKIELAQKEYLIIKGLDASLAEKLLELVSTPSN